MDRVESNDHFVLEFDRSGRPSLERVRYDSRTGDYHHMPIARESAMMLKAYESPAGKWYMLIREMIRLAGKEVD
jgi:hypothetical protein